MSMSFFQRSNLSTFFFNGHGTSENAINVESYELKEKKKSHERKLLSSNHAGLEFVKYATANEKTFEREIQKKKTSDGLKNHKSLSLPLDLHKEAIIKYYNNYNKYQAKKCCFENENENLCSVPNWEGSLKTLQNITKSKPFDVINPNNTKTNFSHIDVINKQISKKSFERKRVEEYLKLIKKTNKLNLKFGNDWQTDEWNLTDFKICKRKYSFQEIEQQFDELNLAIQNFISYYGYPTEELIVTAWETNNRNYVTSGVFEDAKVQSCNGLIFSLQEKISFLTELVYHKSWSSFIENEIEHEKKSEDTLRKKKDLDTRKTDHCKTAVEQENIVNSKKTNELNKKGWIVRNIYKLKTFITFYCIAVPKSFFQKVFSNISNFFKKTDQTSSTNPRNSWLKW